MELGTVVQLGEQGGFQIKNSPRAQIRNQKSMIHARTNSDILKFRDKMISTKTQIGLSYAVEKPTGSTKSTLHVLGLARPLGYQK